MRLEGTRRLSLFLGITGSIGWLIFVLIASEFFSEMSTEGWFVMLAGIPFFFIIPYGLVKGVAWVVDGFNRDKQNGAKNDKMD